MLGGGSIAAGISNMAYRYLAPGAGTAGAAEALGPLPFGKAAGQLDQPVAPPPKPSNSPAVPKAAPAKRASGGEGSTAAGSKADSAAELAGCAAGSTAPAACSPTSSQLHEHGEEQEQQPELPVKRRRKLKGFGPDFVVPRVPSKHSGGARGKNTALCQRVSAVMP